jgi:hypothetical protein
MEVQRHSFVASSLGADNMTHHPLPLSAENYLQNPFRMRLGGHRSRFGSFGEEKHLLFQQGGEDRNLIALSAA